MLSYRSWSIVLLSASLLAGAATHKFPNIRREFLEQPRDIPAFWLTTVEQIDRLLDSRVKTGRVETIGRTAGGRPMRAVVYGKPRAGAGTSTFSGSLGFRDVRAYLGPDSGKKVYMAMAAVHGGEFEGIAGMANLIATLETGRDLRGREWPEIAAAARALDRIILIPITNRDGRARVPVRMEMYRGTDNTVHEYLNTGARADGVNFGWPQCKEFIPLDFSKTQFPGGYPNDAGVNIQHDDFLGRPQPETRALLDLTARERPDLILNLHTGAVYPLVHRPFLEPALTPAWEGLFRRIQGRLALEGLQGSRDPNKEGDPKRSPLSTYNLDTALSLHCGAISTVIESPSHSFTSAKTEAGPRPFSADELVTAQLLMHLEGMKYLAETGGRVKWASGGKK